MITWLQQLTPPANVAGADLTAYVLLDIFLIVVLARILGTLMARIGQPRVVGEILAGVLLGPTLLGQNLSQVIAPLQARPILGAIGTLALVLFMFVAGIEFDLSKIQDRAGQAGLLAVLSVAVPAALGFPVAALMHSAAYAGTAGADLLAFGLFLGAALSVTAFPVMAHILMERGELNSPMGGLGVATAGLISVLMFIFIAFAGAVAAASGFSGLLTKIGLMLVFMLLSWFVVRPWLARVIRDPAQKKPLSGNTMALIFGGMVLYGVIADRVGINALVGGFFWGLILPSSRMLRAVVAAKVNDLAMVFFLPIFFALAGFSTDLKLITVDTLPIVALVLLAAIAGKFIAAVPARAFGLGWGQVGILGSLFNTRGLLVLVAGLIGLQLNIITNLTFTIIVIVALVTNLMTLPLLNLFTRPQPAPAEAVKEGA